MLLVLRLGASVGVKGLMRFTLISDFPEFLKVGRVLYSKTLKSFEIAYISLEKSHIGFKDVNSLESAKLLTNTELFASEDESKKELLLKEDEYFYDDVVGLSVIEDSKVLGKVVDIQRINTTDYLHVKTPEGKIFLLPYIDRFVLKIDLESKSLFSIDALYLLP
ncbi:16S rRNA processing protein RimM [Helicobacter sp. 13S00401-1]|uniref:ribosome maturation factor RimM n=1 Tax=Helicobacter sp. 13S00401-1 TaxID=1905758 RepID=UPI000BD232E7|nr:ribosome maturation factor RimM [Helicobacter sp. 13S00401-1]PAF50994.1 16S rRNA processing protein RimM [Helicobacter sp. 13S00401-1]